MPHQKQYASYKSLSPNENKPTYTCIDIKGPQHRNNIISENSLVCIDLYADWCGPCKEFGPKFAELAQQYNIPGKCALVKENVNLELTGDYQITSIPAFIFYHKGELVKSHDGNPVHVVGGDIGKIRNILDKLIPQLK